MKLVTICVFVFWSMFVLPANAAPVSYSFSGTLTGESRTGFSLTSLENVPFRISIYGDTDNAAHLGTVAGAGSLYANSSSRVVWEVNGFGTATSSSSQIYAIPGIAIIGFSWDGFAYPTDISQTVPTTFDFRAGEIATDSTYSRLHSTVSPISVTLVTSLQNPPDVLPQFTTSVYFAGVGSLTLKELANVTYEVSAVPAPSAALLLASGLVGLLGFMKYHAT